MYDDPHPRLYVVEILYRGSPTGVKIGISLRWSRRLAQHRYGAINYGCTVGRSWSSEPHPAARQIEALMKKQVSVSGKSEFLELPFEAVVAGLEGIIANYMRVSLADQLLASVPRSER